MSLTILFLLAHLCPAGRGAQQCIPGRRRQLEWVSAPKVAEVVKEKISELNIPTVHVGSFDDTYVVPLACQDTRLILSIRVDPETGEVLKTRNFPDFRQPEEVPKRPVRPKITNKKALEVVNAELKRGLKVGAIYRSPTEWYTWN